MQSRVRQIGVVIRTTGVGVITGYPELSRGVQLDAAKALLSSATGLNSIGFPKKDH